MKYTKKYLFNMRFVLFAKLFFRENIVFAFIDDLKMYYKGM